MTIAWNLPIVLSGLPPAFNQDQYGDLSPPADYSEEHDISLAQDTPDIGIEEEDSFITRLNITANDINSGKTLQSLRDSINTYLRDIDQKLEADNIWYSNVEEENWEVRKKLSSYKKFCRMWQM